MSTGADVVVIGAGIAGVSTAYSLSVRHGVERVVIVDPRPPLTLTSDKSTECYRNWWPNRPMVGLMNRSIDLLEEMAGESGNAFGLNQRGYLFVTARESTFEDLREQVAVSSTYGARADVLERADIAERFPYITPLAVGGVFVSRAGWFSAQQLGSWMLDRIRDSGGRLIPAEAADISVDGVTLDDGSSLATDTVVIAAGPMSKAVAAMAGVDVPLFSELHLKVSFRDHLGVVPRQAPMIIWSDPQRIDWTDEEQSELERMGRFDVLGDMPIYCHGRPEGGDENPYFLALWEYHQEVIDPVWPLPEDELYAEVVMRGLATMVPGLSAYLTGLPESHVDGGYYTKTRENRPLIGPAGSGRVHLVAGLSGFGVMVAAGAGDLAARHITGSPLPDYADDFLLSRYDDPAYLAEIASLEDSGQL